MKKTKTKMELEMENKILRENMQRIYELASTSGFELDEVSKTLGHIMSCSDLNNY